MYEMVYIKLTVATKLTSLNTEMLNAENQLVKLQKFMGGQTLILHHLLSSFNVISGL